MGKNIYFLFMCCITLNKGNNVEAVSLLWKLNSDFLLCENFCAAEYLSPTCSYPRRFSTFLNDYSAKLCNMSRNRFSCGPKLFGVIREKLLSTVTKEVWEDVTVKLDLWLRQCIENTNDPLMSCSETRDLSTADTTLQDLSFVAAFHLSIVPLIAVWFWMSRPVESAETEFAFYKIYVSLATVSQTCDREAEKHWFLLVTTEPH